MEKNKYDFLYERNKEYMDLTALSFGDKKITYEQLHDNIQKYVKMLYAKGVREGDVIGVIALNTPESVYLLYALDVIGAITVGLSPIDKKENLKRDIQEIKPKMVISVDMCYDNFKDSEKALNFSTILYSPLESVDNLKLKFGYNAMQFLKGNYKLSKNSNLSHLLKKNYDGVVPEKSVYTPGKLTDILFTGGSTGIHKGVDLSGDGLNSVVEGMDSIFKSEPGMVHLGNIPIGHMAYGRMIMHYSLCNNMELALTLKALPSDFYDEIVRTHANAAVGGPPHWVTLIQKNGDSFAPNSKLKPNTLSELHYATSGGEAKKKTTETAINDALKYCGSDAVLGDGLGATETWASIMINNGKLHQRGTLGDPISTVDVKLVNPETGEEVKKGDKGLLYVSGPSVMLGYHNNPEETSNVISYDEENKKWLNTGDILRQNPLTGEYQYIGRKKRNFVSGIENIYPEELESLLLNLPEVREVVVTAIPDDMVQYIPRYHISLYDKNIDYKEFERKMNLLVESRLGENWLPGTVKYYDEPLKKMPNSKINISYYKEQDSKDFADGKINNEFGRALRLKKI